MADIFLQVAYTSEYYMHQSWQFSKPSSVVATCLVPRLLFNKWENVVWKRD